MGVLVVTMKLCYGLNGTDECMQWPPTVENIAGSVLQTIPSWRDWVIAQHK